MSFIIIILHYNFIIILNKGHTKGLDLDGFVELLDFLSPLAEGDDNCNDNDGMVNFKVDQDDDNDDNDSEEISIEEAFDNIAMGKKTATLDAGTTNSDIYIDTNIILILTNSDELGPDQ